MASYAKGLNTLAILIALVSKLTRRTTTRPGNEYLTNKRVPETDEIPKSMIIVGGGYVGVEFAHFFSAVGTDVTILGRSVQLLKGEDSEVSALLLGLHAVACERFYPSQLVERPFETMEAEVESPRRAYTSSMRAA